MTNDIHKKCEHVYENINGTENKKCTLCGQTVYWGVEQEMRYIKDITERELSIAKKELMLKGIIAGYKNYESKNTTTQEDTKLIKYTRALLKELR